MIKRILIVGVAAVVLCAAQAWSAESEFVGKTVDISKLTCKELMKGNDSDRSAGFAIYHGFMMGKNNNTVLDVPAAGALTDAAEDYCLSNPTSTVMEAFTKAGK